MSGRDPHTLPHGQMRFGALGDGHGQVLDRGYVVAFHGPRSFTGDDVVELHCHGSPAVVMALCEAATALGATPAKAGAFTWRAFQAGKLDLIQAEGLLDLVSARSEAARAGALAHLDGHLSDALAALRAPLVALLSQIEARLDFAVHDDVPPLDGAAVAADLGELTEALDGLLASAPAGRLRQRGARVVLYGAPNAGKSTLFNALVGRDQALVHDLPGTTRDLLEGQTTVDGVALTWVDTAGQRPHEPEAPGELGAHRSIEAAGMARAREAAASADLILWLQDGSAPTAPVPPPPEGPPRLRVATKADLMVPPPDAQVPRTDPQPETAPDLHISALRPADLSRLQGAVLARLRATVGTLRSDEVALTRTRHVAGVRAAREAIARAHEAATAGLPGELLAADLRDAIEALDEVMGAVAPDDVLVEIFSRFCVGK